MKKGIILLFSVLVFIIISIEGTNGAWYWTTSVAKTIWDGATWCPSDGDTTWWSPNFSKSPLPWAYTSDVRQIWSSGVNYMWCQKWDGANPTGSVLTVPPQWTWTNGNVTVSITCSDTGGSGCDMYNIWGWSKSWNIYTSSPFSSNTSWSITLKDIAWNSWTAGYNITNIDKTPPTCWTWTQQSGWGQTRIMTLSSSTDAQSWINDTWGSCLVSVEWGTCTEQISDNVWNTTTCTSSIATRVDRTNPSISEFSPNLPNWAYFRANHVKSLSFSTVPFQNAQAPISSIATSLEKYNNKNTVVTKDYTTGNGFTINDNNFSVVNTLESDMTAWNYRPYTLTVNNVCDAAWNCTDFTSNPSTKRTYNVYASNISKNPHIPFNEWWVSNISWETNLTNGTAVANGVDKVLRLTLKDTYGNSIRPVAGHRTVATNINYNNSLYLNQYLQSWNSSVFIGMEQLAIPSWTTPSSGIFVNDSDWIYDFNFKIYTPTENTDWLVNGSFSLPLNSITASVSDFWGSTSFIASLLNFKFKPLYTTTFWNNWIEKYGFIEWVEQTSQINILKNGPELWSWKKVYLEFGWSEKNKLELSANNIWNTDPTVSNPMVSENIWTLSSVFDGISSFVSIHTLKTLLVQSDIINDISKHYLSTHINYTLDGHSITYNWDIVWKDKYNGTFNGINTQIGLKVLWKTYSEKQKNITNNQDWEVQKLDWKISKAILKKDIRKNVYNLIKNLNITDGSYKELWNIIYYKENWGKIKYSTIQPIYKAKIGKTIILIWADLIIEKNDLDTVVGTWVHWIIVLKDWLNWGNILIDDEVEQIDATMYAGGSILPYSTDVWYNRVLRQSDGILFFRNQLLINGSIFTNNTIGWSRKIPLFCPYFVTNLCDIEESQKYDLNFLRRYYIYDSNSDWIVNSNDSPANGWSTVVGNLDSNYTFPLIIKYNSLIQTSPPPLFSK